MGCKPEAAGAPQGDSLPEEEVNPEAGKAKRLQMDGKEGMRDPRSSHARASFTPALFRTWASKIPLFAHQFEFLSLATKSWEGDCTEADRANSSIRERTFLRSGARVPQEVEVSEQRGVIEEGIL